MNEKIHILAADIGGTNSRFAMFRFAPPGGGPQKAASSTPPDFSGLSLLNEVWLPTAGVSSFRDLLLQARSGLGEEQSPERADLLSLAVPAPVYGSAACAPNISWPISLAEAEAVFPRVPAFLVNDFAAQGHACLHPAALDLEEILPGTSLGGRSRVLVGAGTGFGKAVIPPSPLCSGQYVLPSEGGHCGFPFRGAPELAFAAFMERETEADEIIGDRLLSGAGLESLFFYFSGQRLPAREISARLKAFPPESGQDPVGERVMEWMARFYGRACRDAALDALALGGVLVTGGLALNLPGLLRHKSFAVAFRSSAGQAALLADIPLFHVRNGSSGLWGAAIYGLLRMLNHMN